MRIPRLGKTLLAAVLAVVGGLVIAGAASADSGLVKFKGEATVVAVGLADPSLFPTAEFEVDKKGRIRLVEIDTIGEAVVALGLSAECRPGPEAEALCGVLNGSAILSIHNSSTELINPQPLVVSSPLGDLDALSGRIKGSLEGAFLVSPTGDPLAPALVGSAALKIHGEAVYACIIGPMAACQAAGTGLIPVALSVKDVGDFTIDAGIAGGYLVSNGTGKVTVEATLLDAFTGAATGSVTIRNASATLTPIP